MKVHLPIVGKATGSSAGLIYQSYWGNTYTRSFPFSFHYPDTAKQQKCQFDFFQIQRAWWPIYNQLKFSIPKQCRRNTNVYNELSNGLYRVFMTYAPVKSENVLQIWGLDKRKSVLVDLKSYNIVLQGGRVFVNCFLYGFYGKRKFVPSVYNMLLCNISKQEFYLKVTKLKSDTIEERFVITSEWSQSDIIVAYVAFSNDEFFTNFYLCSL